MRENHADAYSPGVPVDLRRPRRGTHHRIRPNAAAPAAGLGWLRQRRPRADARQQRHLDRERRLRAQARHRRHSSSSRATACWCEARRKTTLTSDRLSLDGRVERKLSARTSLFGATQYLRDSFKAIDYLVSPTVGVSRLLVKDDRTELGVDAGVGVVWEQNPDLEVQTDGAVTAGQQFTRKLTATTELKEKAAALWKMDDFGDALYTFGIGLAASITAGTQLKVEFLDTYKARPPLASVKKNDIAVLVSFVYKFD